MFAVMVAAAAISVLRYADILQTPASPSASTHTNASAISEPADRANPEEAFARAQQALRDGELKVAESWIRKALRERPNRRAYHGLYAEILQKLGRHAEAETEWQRSRVRTRSDTQH
jgi:Tfp pilus assembly protein PilF